MCTGGGAVAAGLVRLRGRGRCTGSRAAGTGARRGGDGVRQRRRGLWGAGARLELPPPLAPERRARGSVPAVHGHHVGDLVAAEARLAARLVAGAPAEARAGAGAGGGNRVRKLGAEGGGGGARARRRRRRRGSPIARARRHGPGRAGTGAAGRGAGAGRRRPPPAPRVRARPGAPDVDDVPLDRRERLDADGPAGGRRPRPRRGDVRAGRGGAGAGVVAERVGDEQGKALEGAGRGHRGRLCVKARVGTPGRGWRADRWAARSGGRARVRGGAAGRGGRGLRGCVRGCWGAVRWGLNAGWAGGRVKCAGGSAPRPRKARARRESSLNGPPPDAARESRLAA
jgi:hypothetical protein